MAAPDAAAMQTLHRARRPDAGRRRVAVHAAQRPARPRSRRSVGHRGPLDGERGRRAAALTPGPQPAPRGLVVATVAGPKSIDALPIRWRPPGAGAGLRRDRRPGSRSSAGAVLSRVLRPVLVLAAVCVLREAVAGGLSSALEHRCVEACLGPGDAIGAMHQEDFAQATAWPGGQKDDSGTKNAWSYPALVAPREFSLEGVQPRRRLSSASGRQRPRRIAAAAHPAHLHNDCASGEFEPPETTELRMRRARQ